MLHTLCYIKHSHSWSSCSNQCGGCLLPGRSRLFSSRCPPSPKRCEQQDLCGCTEPIKTDITGTEVLTYKRPDLSQAVATGYLFGGQVLHASGHLESAGHQVFDGHVLHRDLIRVVAVLHARWTPSSQVLPQVTLRGKLYDHIQRTCTQRGGTQPSEHRTSWSEATWASTQKKNWWQSRRHINLHDGSWRKFIPEGLWASSKSTNFMPKCGMWLLENWVINSFPWCVTWFLTPQTCQKNNTSHTWTCCNQ